MPKNRLPNITAQSAKSGIKFLHIKQYVKNILSEGIFMENYPNLDEIDRRILRELRRDGRLSNARLAETVGLSTTPCWNRVRALESAGVIEGYTALLNQQSLGLPDTVIIEVTLERHDDDMLEKFGEALAGLPEVMEAYLLTGEYDYLIKVAVAGTAGYEEFLRRKLYKLPGIRHSRSTFVLRCLKRAHSVEP
jgi:Lrp/AsnC family transcriptional regulator, leucine-responsive regulatory protein